MKPLRIAFLMRPHGPQTSDRVSGAVQVLAQAGVSVDVIHLDRSVLDLESVRVRHDLYVLRKRSGLYLGLAGALDALGAAIVNPYKTSVTLRNKIITSRVLQAAGVPTPASFVVAHPRDLAPLLEAGPLIVKPYQGRCGKDIRVVRTAADLAGVTVTPDEPVFAQRYHQPDGGDRKLYVVGDRVFGLVRTFPARSPEEKRGQPFEPSVELSELARRCGRAFGIDLLGVDVIESGGSLYVVDISSMPSFRGVPEAPTRLAQYFYRAARQAAYGVPVLATGPVAAPARLVAATVR